MNTYSNISQELKAYFSGNAIFKILLPIDMVLLFAGLIVLVLNNLYIIKFGGFIYQLAFWAFILGLLLTYANMRQMYLYIGLFGYGALNILDLIITLFKGSFSWYNLFYAAVFGGLGYVVFRHAVTEAPVNTDLNN